MTAVRTRFAPSPTGLLHLGNGRTALFNALLARAGAGALVLRIEDTDAARSEARYLEALTGDLAWLGIEWQEGLGAGGEAGPYRQSERAGIYARHFQALESGGHAYPCFCSLAALQAARRAQLAAGRPPRYPGTCAGIPAAEAAARVAAGEAATLRFRVPPRRAVVYTDQVRGPQRFDTDTIGDFVIRRTDGTPAFFFSNAVDDALMGISHVLRGEDHLTNTPRQLLLLEALGLPAPSYGHLPLVLAEDGAPLSKRAGSLSLRALREDGYLPGALQNYLARLGHHYDDGAMDLEALAAGFDPARVGSAPARFDPGQLRHWQREAVGRLAPPAWWLWVQSAVADVVPPDQAEAFREAVRDNVLFPGEAAEWARRLFEDPLVITPEAAAALAGADPAVFDAALDEGGDAAGFGALAERVKRATGARGRGLFAPLRAALTGLTHGPELGRIYPLLGRERVRARLLAARATAAAGTR